MGHHTLFGFFRKNTGILGILPVLVQYVVKFMHVIHCCINYYHYLHCSFTQCGFCVFSHWLKAMFYLKQ